MKVAKQILHWCIFYYPCWCVTDGIQWTTDAISKMLRLFILESMGVLRNMHKLKFAMSAILIGWWWNVRDIPLYIIKDHSVYSVSEMSHPSMWYQDLWWVIGKMSRYDFAILWNQYDCEFDWNALKWKSYPSICYKSSFSVFCYWNESSLHVITKFLQWN